MISRHLANRGSAFASRLGIKCVSVTAIVIAVVIVFVLWTTLDWEWSTIDDPKFVIAARDLGFANWPSRVWFEVGAALHSDQSWGLFRPSYWLYPSLVYWLPNGIVHGIRLAMLLVAITGPLFELRRRGMPRNGILVSGLILLAASSALTTGLFYLSLQELSGAAFIGLGFVFRSGNARTACWLFAAWFKSPFAWILIAEAFVQWRMGRRIHAALNGTLGLSTLAAAWLFAMNGGYTAKYGLDLWRIMTNASKLVEVWTALLLILVLWWVVVTRTVLNFTELSLLSLIAFCGYTGQLLPWAVSGYYMGPIVYLFGVFLASMITVPSVLNFWKSLLAFSMPVAITVWVTYVPLAQGLQSNHVLREITRCLVSHNGQGLSLSGHLDYVTTEEGVLRMTQNAELADPTWEGRLSLADSVPVSARILCSSGPVTVFR